MSSTTTDTSPPSLPPPPTVQPFWRSIGTKPCINLARGQPQSQHLPRSIIQTAAAQAIGNVDVEQLLQYGDEQGNTRYLRELAGFITRSLERQNHLQQQQQQQQQQQPPQQQQPQSLSVGTNQLFATSGVSQGLSQALMLYSQPGDVIFVEDPCYHLSLGMMNTDHRLRVVGVPIDHQGMDVDELERKILQHINERHSSTSDDIPAFSRHRYYGFIYTIPAYHNPTSVTLSHERRAKMVELAIKYNLAILADEVYQFLPFPDESPPPLMPFFDSTGRHVLSFGSFSKILAPGLRLGWILSGPRVIHELASAGVIRSGGNNGFLQEIVTETMIQCEKQLDVLTTRTEELGAIYSERCRVLCEALHENFEGLPVSFHIPKGGYFVWINLHHSLDMASLLPLCRDEYGVAYSPGKLFSCSGSFQNCIRVCFAHYESEDLVHAIKMLSKAVKATIGVAQVEEK